ncbi:MAG: ArnT family glycosyltransferase [Dehalococcoidia bacterium]
MELDAPAAEPAPRNRAAARTTTAAFRTAAGVVYRYRELTLVAALTAAGAFVRLWRLTTLPYGFHNDEGNVTLDAQRILHEGWIGAYSGRALGYPIAVDYFVAPFIKVFGATVLGVRLPIAVLGIACVPLVYGVARIAAGWRVAICATIMLAFSLWHLHLSRVGFPVMGWAVTELGSLLCLQIGLKRQRWPWFVGAGLLIGVGTWVYNSAFLYAVAVAIYLVGWYVARNFAEVRAAVTGVVRPRRLPVGPVRELLMLLILLASTALAAAPIVRYAMTSRQQYESHFKSASIFNRPPHNADSLPEKVRVTEHNVKRLFWALTSTARPDGADGLGSAPPVGALTMYAAIVGAAIALVRFRSPVFGIGLLVVPLLLISTAVTIDGQYRRTFGLMPFIAIFAGLALGTVWERADRYGGVLRVAGVGVVVVILAAVSYHNLSYYFRDYNNTSLARFVFYPEMREASEYLDAHGHPYVYMYSDRASLGHESRRVLAPNIAGGEDRSTEFAPGPYTLRYDLAPEARPAFPATRQPDGVVFLFLGKYVNDAEKVAQRYPGGIMSETDTPRLHVVDFRAYYLPANLLEYYARQEGVTIPVRRQQ